MILVADGQLDESKDGGGALRRARVGRVCFGKIKVFWINKSMECGQDSQGLGRDDYDDYVCTNDPNSRCARPGRPASKPKASIEPKGSIKSSVKL